MSENGRSFRQIATAGVAAAESALLLACAGSPFRRAEPTPPLLPQKILQACPSPSTISEKRVVNENGRTTSFFVESATCGDKVAVAVVGATAGGRPSTDAECVDFSSPGTRIIRGQCGLPDGINSISYQTDPSGRVTTASEFPSQLTPLTPPPSPTPSPFRI